MNEGSGIENDRKDGDATPRDANKYTVVFQPSGKVGLVDGGESVKEASVLLGVDIEGQCGEQGTCGKCRVCIREGNYEKFGIVSRLSNLSPVSGKEREFLSVQEERQGYRLACQARIHGDILVFVPEESRMHKQFIHKKALDIPFALNPAVKSYYVELPEATLDDHRADWERLRHELAVRHRLENLDIDYRVLQTLQRVVRDGGWKVSVYVWHDREVIKVEPGKADKCYGMALDIGTTSLAGYLCDLNTGKLITSASLVNPQAAHGEDVISRIFYAMTCADGLARLNRSVLDGICRIIEDACADAGIEPQDIFDMTIVGNTCMHHIFLGIDPQHIAKAPFIPALYASLDIKACDIGVQLTPGAYVHILPIEAGFVGADNVAALITEEPQNKEAVELIIDIGTNGELILGNRRRLISCSVSTGPAFEGSEIKHGMRAAPGAIERIVIDRATKEVRFKVIGQEEWSDEKQMTEARGICGSAIIDILPQLLLASIIDRTGRFLKEVNSPRFRKVDGMSEFVIAWAKETCTGRDIVISQKDVRAIQLAKAAMYAGIKVMMWELGIAKIDRVILAGAFGSNVNKKSAALLGLFPDCDIGDVVDMGNAAGDGARLALLNVNKRKEAEEMSRRVEYLELTRSPNFAEQFVQAMCIPHMNDKFPHLEGLIP